MIIYLSIGSTPSINFMDSVEPTKNWNCLTSFQYRECLRGRTPKDFKNFMADSGAFTAMNAGKKIDAKYIDDYIAWIKANDIKNFVEMDLDEIIGYDKTLEIRNHIEKETGRSPIPVWHFERGEQGWVDMCKQYPYVSISLSRMTSTSKWLQKYNFQPLDWFMKVARQNRAKVHALGCNDLQLLRRYHFYSADSSVHSLGQRFGNILCFKDGKIINLNKHRVNKVNRQKVNENNMKVMMEVMRYAEEKL